VQSLLKRDHGHRTGPSCEQSEKNMRNDGESGCGWLYETPNHLKIIRETQKTASY